MHLCARQTPECGSAKGQGHRHGLCAQGDVDLSALRGWESLTCAKGNPENHMQGKQATHRCTHTSGVCSPERLSSQRQKAERVPGHSERGAWGWCLMGMGCQFCVLEMAGGDGYVAAWVYFTSLHCVLAVSGGLI